MFLFTNDYTIPLAMATSGLLCLGTFFVFILISLRTRTIKMNNFITNVISCLISIGLIFWANGSIQKVDEQLERSKLALEVKSIHGNTRSNYITVKTAQGNFKIDNRQNVTIMPGSKITIIKHKANPYYTVTEYELK